MNYQNARDLLTALLNNKNPRVKGMNTNLPKLSGMNTNFPKLLGVSTGKQTAPSGINETLEKLLAGVKAGSNKISSGDIIPSGDRSQVPISNQYAEGGDVQAPRATQSWQAPEVQARRTQLTPVYAPGQVPANYQGPYIDPTVLSTSQQYARDRESQDRALAAAFSAAGAQSPVGRDYRQTQQAMRRGEITEADLKARITDPIFESRVRNAYAAIGRTGGVTTQPLAATAAAYKQVPQAEMDYYIQQYQQGNLDPKQFEKIFLTQEAARTNLIEAAGKTPALANPYAANAAKLLGQLGTAEVPTVKKGFTTAQYLTPGTPMRFFAEGGDVKK